VSRENGSQFVFAYFQKAIMAMKKKGKS